MPLSTIFHLYHGSFGWWRKPEYPEKTTDLSQVTDKLYHIKLLKLKVIMLYTGFTSFRWSYGKHTLYTIRYLLFEWICIYTNILCYELIKNNNILLKQEYLPRVLQKFSSRWRIFGSRRRLDIPQAWAGVKPRGGIPPSLLAGGPPPENFEILDGRRCNLGIYLRKMKLLIGLKNAGFLGWICVPLKEKLKKSKLQSKCHKIRTDWKCHGKHWIHL